MCEKLVASTGSSQNCEREKLHEVVGRIWLMSSCHWWISQNKLLNSKKSLVSLEAESKHENQTVAILTWRTAAALLVLSVSYSVRADVNSFHSVHAKLY